MVVTRKNDKKFFGETLVPHVGRTKSLRLLAISLGGFDRHTANDRSNLFFFQSRASLLRDIVETRRVSQKLEIEIHDLHQVS